MCFILVTSVRVCLTCRCCYLTVKCSVDWALIPHWCCCERKSLRAQFIKRGTPSYSGLFYIWMRWAWLCAPWLKSRSSEETSWSGYGLLRAPYAEV